VAGERTLSGIAAAFGEVADLMRGEREALGHVERTRPGVTLLLLADPDDVAHVMAESAAYEMLIHVSAVGSYSAAVAALTIAPYDVVLAVRRLPDVDGQRLVEFAHPVPVIMLGDAEEVPDAVTVRRPTSGDGWRALMRQALRTARAA